jgi:hypothetical protein
LEFKTKHKNLHLILFLMLAGDIASNPGPESNQNDAFRCLSFNAQSLKSVNKQQQLQQLTDDRKCFAKCLVVNARSLLSVRKSEGKRTCQLGNFQELVYSEDADIVWVTETWLRDDVGSREILPWGYNIYRKDRKLRGGGVLLAIKSSSFSSYREIDYNTNLELVMVELTSNSNMKYLLCCCYKSQQFVICEQ